MRIGVGLLRFRFILIRPTALRLLLRDSLLQGVLPVLIEFQSIFFWTGLLGFLCHEPPIGKHQTIEKIIVIFCTFLYAPKPEFGTMPQNRTLRTYTDE